MTRWTTEDAPLDPALLNVDDRLEKGTVGRLPQMYDDPDAPDIVLLTPLSLADDVWNVIAAAPDCGRFFRLEAHARGEAVTRWEDDWKVRGAGDRIEIAETEYQYGGQYHDADDAGAWFRLILNARIDEPTAHRDEFGHEDGERFYLYEPFAPARATAKLTVRDTDDGDENEQ